MSDVLARILESKREHVRVRRTALPLSELTARMDLRPTRGFAAALRGAGAADGLALIAEIKRASPSKGLIREDFDVASLARAYAAGGAACLSVLTDRPYFQGDDAYLKVAAVARLPILRKDFIIDPYQVAESRFLGADCILLIIAALADAQAAELAGAAAELGLDVLVEVHDAEELARALRLPAELIGINNRNLKTLAVDLATTLELAPAVPKDRLVVAESGLAAHTDLLHMRAAGARAFLVGEALMAQPDVTQATRRLLGREAPA